MRQAKIHLAAFVLALTCVGCARPAAEEDTTAYDRILAAGRIRVGYISYPPSFIKDANTGEYSGIFHEILAEIAKNIDLKIDYVEEVAWGTMIEAIQSGRVDLVCTGIWPTGTRGRHADFTDPLYYSTVRAYTRVGDTRFDGNLGAINDAGVRISVIDGEMTSIIARTDFATAVLQGLPQTSDISQVLLEVATRKADVTFVEPAVAGAYMASNPGTIAPVADVPPLRIFPNVMMVGKGEVELLSTLNIALEELVNTGFVQRVVDKYEQYPGSFERRRPPV